MASAAAPLGCRIADPPPTARFGANSACVCGCCAGGSGVDGVRVGVVVCVVVVVVCVGGAGVVVGSTLKKKKSFEFFNFYFIYFYFFIFFLLQIGRLHPHRCTRFQIEKIGLMQFKNQFTM
jgi:hypothetical protein